MRRTGKSASILLACVGLFAAWFASPVLAAERGNAADFIGVWDTVIKEVNAKYKITLRHTGTNPDGSLIISGEFVNKQDSQYNGTINGVADPNLDGTPSGGEFSYYYYQPKVKAAGTGSFIVDKNGWMGGFVKADGDNKRYGWEGKRISKGPKPKPAEKGFKIIAQVTGYDAPGGNGNDKCYLNPGETAASLGVYDPDPTWKHLQGIGACDGQDFWVYDDGVLQAL